MLLPPPQNAQLLLVLAPSCPLESLAKTISKASPKIAYNLDKSCNTGDGPSQQLPLMKGGRQIPGSLSHLTKSLWSIWPSDIWVKKDRGIGGAEEPFVFSVIFPGGGNSVQFPKDSLSGLATFSSERVSKCTWALCNCLSCCSWSDSSPLKKFLKSPEFKPGDQKSPTLSSMPWFP